MMPPPKKKEPDSRTTNPPRRRSAAARTIRLSGPALPRLGLAAPFGRGRRAPRLFMIAIVALYSRTRRASSSRRSFSSFSRSAPTAAGDAGGAAPLRMARTASFGCFACASALASSRVTGPAIRSSRLLGTCFGSCLGASYFLAFLRFRRLPLVPPHWNVFQS